MTCQAFKAKGLGAGATARVGRGEGAHAGTSEIHAEWHCWPIDLMKPGAGKAVIVRMQWM